jgi:hypothetical protein
MDRKEKIARENVLKESEEPSGLKIKGYDFDNGLSYKDGFSGF